MLECWSHPTPLWQRATRCRFPPPIRSAHPGNPGRRGETAWRSQQIRKRSYADDVQSKVERLRGRFDVVEYGRLDYAPDSYRYSRSRAARGTMRFPPCWSPAACAWLRDSGVHGALQFVDQHLAETRAGQCGGRACVSPWAYERIHRWNPDSIDPNRSFRDDSPAQESAALMRLLARGAIAC